MRYISFMGIVLGVIASVFLMSSVQANDSICPPGMHSPDGNVCVPGASMNDENNAIRNMPYKPPTTRGFTHWSALAIDKKKLFVSDKEIKFIGVSNQHRDMKKAEKVALEMCKSDGSDNCEIVATVPNQCLAISISVIDKGLQYIFAPDMEQAIHGSMMKCNAEYNADRQYTGCKIAYAQCSYRDL